MVSFSVISVNKEKRIMQKPLYRNKMAIGGAIK